MTIAEAEKFYNQDKKEYILDKNIVFLRWFREQIKNGYHSFLEIEELQKIINFLVSWYELK